MRKLVGTISVSAIAALTLAVSASSAGAAVTIGQLAPSSPPVGCTNGPSDFAQAAVSSGNAYVVPPLSTAGAVVTSWSHSATAGAGQMMKMKIWRQVSGSTYEVVGHDGPVTLTGGQLNTFTTRIRVKPGDVLGLNNQNAQAVDNACLFAAAGDPGPLANFGDTADGATTTFVSNVANFRVNATARIEPDADNDGFGDETQDQCPSDASTQGTCAGGGGGTGGGGGPADTNPPETKITKGAPNKTEKTKVKFKFRSDEDGSTFECKKDKKPWKRCSSPTKMKHLDEGKHKFKVRATDAAGNTDPTPAKDKFKVTD